jgi:hypothetical protein
LFLGKKVGRIFHIINKRKGGGGTDSWKLDFISACLPPSSFLLLTNRKALYL